MGRMVHPNGPAEFRNVGRKFLFWVNKNMTFLFLQGNGKLEMGWGRQRKLQEKRGERKKEHSGTES